MAVRGAICGAMFGLTVNEDTSLPLPWTRISNALSAGDMFSLTFDKPGDYEGYCLPHPWMRGKIIVK